MPIKFPDFSKSSVRFRASLYAGAAAIFILLSVSAAFPLASNPTFCGKTCHSQAPEYESWKKSSHSMVTCYACHVNPTYTHLLREKLVAGPTGIIDTLRDSYEKPINAESEYSQEVPSERCLRCHSPENRNFTPNTKKGINVTSEMHVKHLEANLECTTCHNRIAHSGAEKFEPLKSWAPDFKYKNFMTMREGCWRCHSDDEKYRDEKKIEEIAESKTAPTDCQICHNPNSPKKPTTGKYNHDDVDGIPWKNGKQRHGVVAKLDFGACTACHQMNAGQANDIPNCTTTCHKGVTMPHKVPMWAKYYDKGSTDAEWLTVHPSEADKFGISEGANWSVNDPNNVCSMCHNKVRANSNFCQSCHHESFDKNYNNLKSSWKEQHPAVVEELGSTQCQKCHLLEFCAYCHTNGKKPARGTFRNRLTVPRESESLD